MATLLALGIPGGGATAIMLGAFALHNVTGGPRFIAENKPIVYAIIVSNLVQSVALMVIGIGFVYVAGAIVKVPVRMLVPSIFAVSVFGCYAITGNIAGPATFLVFTLVGWVMTRYDYPVAATVVGLLLAHLVEGEALRTWQMSGGDPSFLLEHPIAIVLFVLLALSLVWPFIARRLRLERKLAAEADN